MVRERIFLAKDVGDVRGDCFGVVVVVCVVVGIAPASGEASTFLEAGGVCPGGVLRSRGRLEREPGGVVCPQGNLPTMEGTILFLGATEEAAASGGVLPLGLTLDQVELLSGLPPPLLRRIGEVGGHEEARTLATDARVLLVLVLLEDVADLAVVVELLAPLLSAPPELLCEGCVVFPRGGASRHGKSEGEGDSVVGELPGGLVRQVVVVVVFAGSLVSPLVDCANIYGVGKLEAVLCISDARVVLEGPP